MRSAINSITIPAGVILLPNEAFKECNYLTFVGFALGTQLSIIGNYTFSESSINTIDIPSSVKSLGIGAFSYISTLTQVNFYANSELVVIGDECFKSTFLTGKLAIPSFVRYIGASAFQSAEGGFSLLFAADTSIKFIGEYAFASSGVTGDLVLPSLSSGVIVRETAFDNCSYFGNLIYNSSMLSPESCRLPDMDSCSPGSYVNDNKCRPCPPGTWSNTTNSYECALCSINTYSYGAAVECQQCPHGLVSAAGLAFCYPPQPELEPLICLPGYFREGSTEAPKCTACAAGWYSDAEDASECIKIGRAHV